MNLKFITAIIKKNINCKKYWTDLGLKIGNDCEIYHSASFGSEPYLIELGSHVRVSAGVKFITHDGGVWVLRGLANTKFGDKLLPKEMENVDLFGYIKIGNNVHIGTNVTIMPGVNVGNNCIIGCGAIITKDIPENSVAVGVPARVIGTIQEYYTKHIDCFDYTKNLSKKEKELYLRRKFNLIVGCNYVK